MNSITEKIHYISDDNRLNQRFIVDVVCDQPDVWQLSKITRRSPFGTCKLGLYKHEFNQFTDFIDFENLEMYADYYSLNIEPETPILDGQSPIICELTTTTHTLKVGGSYRQVVAKLTNSNGDDVTSEHTYSWKCHIGETDFTESELVSWSESKDPGKTKIKFAKDMDYIGKVLTISCYVDGSKLSDIKLELISS